MDFLTRVKPLSDINIVKKKFFYRYQNQIVDVLQLKNFFPKELVAAVKDFEKKWEEGTFPGWPKESSSVMSHGGAYLDLSPFNSPEELMSLGLDRLKSALTALGLKCGGYCVIFLLDLVIF